MYTNNKVLPYELQLGLSDILFAINNLITFFYFSSLLFYKVYIKTCVILKISLTKILPTLYKIIFNLNSQFIGHAI